MSRPEEGNINNLLSSSMERFRSARSFQTNDDYIQSSSSVRNTRPMGRREQRKKEKQEKKLLKQQQQQQQKLMKKQKQKLEVDQEEDDTEPEFGMGGNHIVDVEMFSHTTPDAQQGGVGRLLGHDDDEVDDDEGYPDSLLLQADQSLVEMITNSGENIRDVEGLDMLHRQLSTLNLVRNLQDNFNPVVRFQVFRDRIRDEREKLDSKLVWMILSQIFLIVGWANSPNSRFIRDTFPLLGMASIILTMPAIIYGQWNIMRQLRRYNYEHMNPEDVPSGWHHPDIDERLPDMTNEYNKFKYSSTLAKWSTANLKYMFPVVLFIGWFFILVARK